MVAVASRLMPTEQTGNQFTSCGGRLMLNFNLGWFIHGLGFHCTAVNRA
jgi:hypothetical protein